MTEEIECADVFVQFCLKTFIRVFFVQPRHIQDIFAHVEYQLYFFFAKWRQGQPD